MIIAGLVLAAFPMIASADSPHWINPNISQQQQ
jgi:hypothetical protein